MHVGFMNLKQNELFVCSFKKTDYFNITGMVYGIKAERSSFEGNVEISDHC
jgi:hypothetical protein